MFIVYSFQAHLTTENNCAAPQQKSDYTQYRAILYVCSVAVVIFQFKFSGLFDFRK